MNRKRVILAALLGVLALCLVYAYLAMPRLEKAPPRTSSQGVRQSVDKASTAQQGKFSKERIDFSFLNVDDQEFPGASRDVFRFGQRRPQATDIPASRPEVKIPPPVVVEPPKEEMVPIEVVQKALSQFTFVGFLDKAGEKTVFLSSEGSMFLAKQGEKFGNDLEFTVTKISGNLLQVSHSGREGLIEIPLIEKQKLTASVSSPARLPAMAPVSQPRSEVFNPNRRMLRPAAPQENEDVLPGTIEENNPDIEENNPDIEENNPEGEPEGNLTVEGDDAEGEANGSNQ